jgi:hypothetical protein
VRGRATARDDYSVSDDETLLEGGGDHHGRLRRFGDKVVRPSGRHSSAVHAFLQHLEAGRFDGAPRAVSLTSTEEVLTFVKGDVPVPPEPPADGWIVVPDEQAASVGSLLARFHGAARTFPVPKGANWQPPGGGTRGSSESDVSVPSMTHRATSTSRRLWLRA